jgi:hypothetical protein
MGIEDSVRGAAENALRDLSGLSQPADDAHTPEPGDPGEKIGLHSSISEGSNAEEDADHSRPDSGSRDSRLHGQESAQAPGHGAAGHAGHAGHAGNIVSDEGGGEGGGADSAGEGAAAGPPRDVAGPGGLPGPDPGGLRADPSESEADPSSSMGRG